MTTNPHISSPAAAAIAGMRMIDEATFKAATTVVPKGAKLEGAMSASSDLALRIEGEFKGKLILATGGAIHIGLGSVVDCEAMEADIIYVQGTIKGSVHARKSLELGPSSRIKGNVRYDDRLDVHSGARVSGSIKGPEVDGE